jgi:methylated-DNA-protein-cysteine methyltransferase-like protein
MLVFRECTRALEGGDETILIVARRDSRDDMKSNYDRIYHVVKRIPPGYVATYGQVASLAGLYGQARLVGYAMAALPEGSDVPWHRVINARGRISRRSEPHAEKLQRLLLESEGVCFDETGRALLTRHLWNPEP